MTSKSTRLTAHTTVQYLESQRSRRVHKREEAPRPRKSHEYPHQTVPRSCTLHGEAGVAKNLTKIRPRSSPKLAESREKKARKKRKR